MPGPKGQEKTVENQWCSQRKQDHKRRFHCGETMVYYEKGVPKNKAEGYFSRKGLEAVSA